MVKRTTQRELLSDEALRTEREHLIWETLLDPGSYNPLTNGFFWVGVLWGIPLSLLFLSFHHRLGSINPEVLIRRQPLHLLLLLPPLLFGVLFGLVGSMGHRYVQRLRQESINDYLTGLYNHRFFREELGQRIDEAQRYNRSFCLILFDLDHFKHVNDEYGHQVGDQVLQEFARLLDDLSRESDTVFRYGGEEFALILPESELSDGYEMAERIRTRVAEHDFGIDRQVTVSGGVAEYPCDSTEQMDLIQVVDERLYEAKGAGRNTVIAGGETSRFVK